jgi:hypothetical protein
VSSTDLAGLADGRQVDEPCASRQPAVEPRAQLDRQAGLAAARRAHQRDDPRLAGQAQQLGHLGLAAEEAGQGDRQRPAPRRRWRRLG